MEIAVRRLGPGDADTLAVIALEAADFDLADRSNPEPPLAPSDAEAYLANPAVLHWVAEHQGRVVGELLCHLLPMPSGAGDELLLYAIGVRGAYRRQGVGRALMAELRRWAEGVRLSDVWVLADNPGAEAFYAACGFRRGEDDEQGVLMLLADQAPPEG
jgi:GNAT superfamily N-acetyltransferase